MKKIIYIEKDLKKLDRTEYILSKYKKKQIFYIDRYTEVFNKRNQSFKIQKTNQALILAKKHSNFISKTPVKYTIGNKYNFYFSYMYNCLFDCKYCFLQGLYSSANFVIFLNYDDFFEEIRNKVRELASERITFFSGYDCDSLVYDRNTGFIDKAIDFFSELKEADLEIRTKSTYIKPLLRHSKENIIIAYSFTPSKFSRVYEKGVPDLKKRINSIKQIINLGWKVGLRFDPFIIYDGCEKDYEELFKSIFDNIPRNQIHSVTFGNLRFPKHIFKNIQKENLVEKLFINLENNSNFVEQPDKRFIKKFCKEKLLKFVDKDKIFSNL